MQALGRQCSGTPQWERAQWLSAGAWAHWQRRHWYGSHRQALTDLLFVLGTEGSHHRVFVLSKFKTFGTVTF